MEAAFNPLSATYGALIFWAIAVPLLAAALLMVGALPRRIAQDIAAVGFALPFAAAIRLFIAFPDAFRFGGFAFYTEVPLGLPALGIGMKLGLNGISMPLFLMASVVGLAAGFYALFEPRERKQTYLALLLVMFAGLLGLFASIDLFFFYFFHELALIPTFIMIGIWGGRARRIAAIEMTIYLTLGAMLVLLGLIAFYVQSGASSFDFITLRAALSQQSLSDLVQHNVYGLLLFGFGILVSLFPFHTWAPRGYANAPASAAMLHAGVLKKFGLYGLIQMVAPLLPQGAAAWTPVLLWLALGNVIIIGLITLSQRDLRYMLGYGSVMHMGYAFLGLATFSVIGIGGAIFMMFAHGLAIAALFLLADCIDKRGGTTEIKQFGGMARQTPVLATLFIAAMLASAGLPGFANFWGELSIFLSLFKAQPAFGAAAVLGIIITAVYGLRAVAAIFFGEPSPAYTEHTKAHPPADLSLAERIPALLLLLALLAVGIWPRMISDGINAEVSRIYPDQQPAQTQTVALAPAAAVEAPVERTF